MNHRFIRALTLWKKEMMSLFFSPVAACAVFLFLLGTCIPFLFPSETASTAVFSFRKYVSGMPLLFIIILPALTMGIWTDERKKGTDLMLFSLPVEDFLLVAGKFFALLTLYCIMMLLTLPVLLMLPPTSFDFGAVITAYTVLFLYGASIISIGQFLSSFFSNSVLSYLVTAAVLLVVNTSELLPLSIHLPGWAVWICTQMSFAWHFDSASRGILDSRDLLFFILPALAFLYANTIHLAERRKGA